MDIEKFKEELNHLGIEEVEDKTNNLLSVLYKSDDPIIIEIMNSSDQKNFLDAYLKSTLIALKNVPNNINSIINNSPKIVEELKKASPIYSQKKIEYERKNTDKLADEVKIMENIDEKFKKYESASISEKLEMNRTFYIKTGATEQDIRILITLDERAENLNNLYRRFMAGEVSKEMLEKSINEFGKYWNSLENNEGTSTYARENLGNFKQYLDFKAKAEGKKDFQKDPLYIAKVRETYNGLMYAILQVTNADDLNNESYRNSIKARIRKTIDGEAIITDELLNNFLTPLSDYKKESQYEYDDKENNHLENTLEPIEKAYQDETEILEFEMKLSEMTEEDFLSEILLIEKVEEEKFTSFDQPLTDPEAKNMIDEHGTEMIVADITEKMADTPKEPETNLENRTSEEQERDGMKNQNSQVNAKKQPESQVRSEGQEPRGEHQEVQPEQLENKQEKQEISKELIPYKIGFRDVFKSFTRDMKNIGIMEAFRKNFIDRDVTLETTKEELHRLEPEDLKGIRTNEEQENISQKENIEKQTLMTRIKDTVKKAFGVKDSTAEKVAETKVNETPESGAQDESKTDFLKVNPEFTKKTNAVSREFAEKPKEELSPEEIQAKLNDQEEIGM